MFREKIPLRIYTPLCCRKVNGGIVTCSCIPSPRGRSGSIYFLHTNGPIKPAPCAHQSNTRCILLSRNQPKQRRDRCSRVAQIMLQKQNYLLLRAGTKRPVTGGTLSLPSTSAVNNDTRNLTCELGVLHSPGGEEPSPRGQRTRVPPSATSGAGCIYSSNSNLPPFLFLLRFQSRRGQSATDRQARKNGKIRQ